MIEPPRPFDMKGKYRLPAGATYNLRTREWRWQGPMHPAGPRPAFEKIKADPEYIYGVMADSDPDGLVTLIVPFEKSADGSGDGEIVKVTPYEYDQLERARGRGEPLPPAELGPDHFASGPGPLMSILRIYTMGKGQLADTERGVIFVPRLEMDGNDIPVKDSGFSDDELRTALWLWDRIDWPQHNRVEIEETQDAVFLQAEGVLQRTHFQVTGTLHSKRAMRDYHLTTLERAEEQDPGRWSLGHGGASGLPSGDESQSSIFVRIADIIPFPRGDVPLADLLEFKLKRRDELLRMRKHIDDLVAKIGAAHNDARAWAAEKDELVRAIADQDRVANESGVKLVLRNLDRTLSIDKLLPSVVATATAGAQGGVLSALTVGAGAILTSLGVTWKMGAGQKTPLDYRLSAIKEFGKR